MGLVRINWKPESRELRKFGFYMLVFAPAAFLFLSSVLNGETVGIAVGTVLLACSLMLISLPVSIARYVYLAFMGIAFVTGNIMSRVLIALFFYMVITPIGLALRISGKDPLSLKKDEKIRWIDTPDGQGGGGYERQF